MLRHCSLQEVRGVKRYLSRPPALPRMATPLAPGHCARRWNILVNLLLVCLLLPYVSVHSSSLPLAWLLVEGQASHCKFIRSEKLRNPHTKRIIWGPNCRFIHAMCLEISTLVSWHRNGVYMMPESYLFELIYWNKFTLSTIFKRSEIHLHAVHLKSHTFN